MDEIDAKIAGIEREMQALSAVIDALGRRLATGEKSVRAELNPAIRRHHELLVQLRDVRMASGRFENEPQPLYGPPRR